MTKHQAQLIVALADNDLNVCRTAEAVIYHRNTLNYHYQVIKKETGLDPHRFHDMCKLLRRARNVLKEP